MLNKNPEQDDMNFEIESVIEGSTLNSVMCSEPFTKSAFLIKLLDEVNVPIAYLDFDLLYSGYITSNIILSPKNLELFRPTKENWSFAIKDVISCISKKRALLVIDSLNGFFNLFYNNKDLGIMINSYIMLFVCVAKMSKSRIVITSMANQKNDEWILSLLGRHALELKDMSKVLLEKESSGIRLSVLSHNSKLCSHQIPISFKLR